LPKNVKFIGGKAIFFRERGKAILLRENVKFLGGESKTFVRECKVSRVKAILLPENVKFIGGKHFCY